MPPGLPLSGLAPPGKHRWRFASRPMARRALKAAAVGGIRTGCYCACLKKRGITLRRNLRRTKSFPKYPPAESSTYRFGFFVCPKVPYTVHRTRCPPEWTLLMNRCEKLLQRARTSPGGLSFDEICRLAQCYGFVLRRQRGSHKIYAHPDIPASLGGHMNFQSDNGKAKDYQVRQLLNAIDYLGGN